MHIHTLVNILAVSLITAPTCNAAPTVKCTSTQRIAGAKAIPHAYNLVTLGKSEAAFEKVPFANDCAAFINPNGGPAVQVSVDAPSTRLFADETRQIFSKVTGQYTDFENGTTIIATNVTLGAVHSIKVPVTFSANVFLTYDLKNCLIEKVQAFATIPTKVLGEVLHPPSLPPGFHRTEFL